MDDYLLNAVEMLEIPKNLDIINDTTHVKGYVAKSILKFSSHPSIKKIKEKFNISNRFHVIHTCVEEVRVKISELDVKKAAYKTSIPCKSIVENQDIFSEILCNTFNAGIDKNKSPNKLKREEIKPTIKNDDRSDNESY